MSGLTSWNIIILRIQLRTDQEKSVPQPDRRQLTKLATA